MRANMKKVLCIYIGYVNLNKIYCVFFNLFCMVLAECIPLNVNLPLTCREEWDELAKAL